MSELRAVDGRPAAVIAAELAGIANYEDRRAARLAMREEALAFRLLARRAQRLGKLTDAFAKVGGGSLLTATLLFIIGGNANPAAIAMAAGSLCLFVIGTIYWFYWERHTASMEFQADRLEAILKETERST